MSHQATTTSTLLTVTPEIRNQIFHFLTEMRKTDGKLLEITSKQYHITRLRLTKLILNRQLHQEVLPLYYGNNIFRFTAYLRYITTDPAYLAAEEKKSVSQRAVSPIVYWQGPTVPTESLVKYGKHSFKSWNCDTAAYVLELPPYHLRKLIRTMTMSIPVPPPTEVLKRHRHKLLDFKEVSAELLDWMYPVRELRALGFTGLEKCTVELAFRKERTEREMQEGKVWFEERMADWDLEDGVDFEVTAVWL